MVALALDAEQGRDGPQLVPSADMRIAQERRQQMERSGQRKPREDAAPAVRRPDLDAQSLLPARKPERADVIEELGVGGAAAEEDVLAVVDLLAGLPVGEGVRAPSEVWPALDERYAPTGLRQPPRRRHTGESAPQHDGGAQRLRIPGSLLVAHSLHVSRTFSEDESHALREAVTAGRFDGTS